MDHWPCLTVDYCLAFGLFRHRGSALSCRAGAGVSSHDWPGHVGQPGSGHAPTHHLPELLCLNALFLLAYQLDD